MGNTKKPEIRIQSRRDFATVAGSSTVRNRNATRKPSKNISRRNDTSGNGGSDGGIPTWLRWTAILGILGGICAALGYWGLVFYFENRLPEVFAPEAYEARTQQVSRIFSEDGRVLLELGEEKRTIVPAKQMPKIIKYAVLAAEDADFYEHDGLDYWGMARAMYKNLRDQRYSQGASTITQQVAKTFYLSTEKTIARKLKEVVLARELEQKLSKDEILYLYLNQIYWGHGRYGIYEAARYYFAKKPSELSLAQAALISGLIAAPERYTPFRNFAKAKERQSFVLDQMVSRGWIPKKRAEKAKREKLKAQLNSKHLNDRFVGVGGYATEAVRKKLKELLGSERLKQGGLRIFTSIDARMQVHAERAVRNGLRNNMDRPYRFARPIARKGKRGVPRFIKRLTRKIPKRGVRSGEIVSGIVTKVDNKKKAYVVNYGMGPALMPFTQVERYAKSMAKRKARALYAIGDVLRVSPKLDSVKPWGPEDSMPLVNIEQGPQAALVAISPKTRQIKALVGGYDFKTHPFDRALQAKRQAGSTFKPLVYAAGMETGRIDPLTRVRNVPESYRMGPGRYWKPRNFGGTYDGKNYTLRQALAQSINIIAVKVLEKFVGVSRFSQFAKRVGIDSPIRHDYSIALGSTSVSPLELANSYATFASGGAVAKPMLLMRVEDHHGNVLFKEKYKRRRGTTRKVSYRVTEMMTAVVEHGTGQVAQHLGRPVAAKTGTTDKGKDSWFVGYTPQLVTAVWLGFDDHRPVKKASGGKLAGPIWTKFMTGALAGKRMAQFKAPRGVRPLPAVSAITLAKRAAQKQDSKHEQPAPQRTDSDDPSLY